MQGQSASNAVAALDYASTRAAESFFRSKLGNVDEPTLPFGLHRLQGRGGPLDEAHLDFEHVLSQRVRAHAHRLSVGVATLFHVAWALVVSRTSGQDDVVYGTLLRSGLHVGGGDPEILKVLNVLPLRLSLQQVTAEGLVEQTHRELLELMRHRHSSLAVALRCSGIVGSAPLFGAVLDYRHNVLSRADSGSAAARVEEGLADQERTNHPITLYVDDQGESFAVTAQTDCRIDPRRVVQYVRKAVESLLDALEQGLQTPALSLSIVPESEQRQVLDLFNATQSAFPRQKLVHELFEEQVQRTPGAAAVVYGGQSLTYADLNAKANQLAWYLRESGIGADQMVGICVERSLEMVVGLLGILKAGGAYVPLDPSYPAERLQYMLQDARPRLLLIQDRLRSRIPPTSAQLVCLDADWSQIARESTSNPDTGALGLRSDHLAYVIYTSGSTGQPKGVAIEHRNTVNLLCWARSAMPSELFTRTLLSTSLNFDLSVYECFVPLTLGASIHVVENAMEVLRSRFDVTLINTVPSAIRAIVDSGHIPESARGVNLAGEALKKEVVQLIFERSDVEYVCNLYGPSETTTYSTWVSMSRKDGFIPTIGRPIANTQIYVLDIYRQPVPIGVTGEIYIGGAGVARGYLNRPELTSERFLMDPFSVDPRARLYRTGDLGRWRADGHIEYLGRNDNQVKIRGFRIELGEIEAQLLLHAQVGEAVVLAREDEPGEKRLVAYMVLRDSSEAHSASSVETLRAHLKPGLPDYMMPSAFVLLQSMPLTANGKLDRRALPAPELSAYGSREYEAPQGDIEETLAGIWRAMLRVERVGRQDDFFELGGHSLLGNDMIGQVADTFNVEIPMIALFQHPTVQQFAQFIEKLRVEAA